MRKKPPSILKILVGMQLQHVTPAALLLQATLACSQMLGAYVKDVKTG